MGYDDDGGKQKMPVVVAACNIGFLFCLVDLPFRNPQNCSLGDFATPVLSTGKTIVEFKPSLNFTYKFTLKKLPMVKCL